VDAEISSRSAADPPHLRRWRGCSTRCSGRPCSYARGSRAFRGRSANESAAPAADDDHAADDDDHAAADDDHAADDDAHAADDHDDDAYSHADADAHPDADAHAR
jgi:hypothetical protein